MWHGTKRRRRKKRKPTCNGGLCIHCCPSYTLNFQALRKAGCKMQSIKLIVYIHILTHKVNVFTRAFWTLYLSNRNRRDTPTRGYTESELFRFLIVVLPSIWRFYGKILARKCTVAPWWQNYIKKMPRCTMAMWKWAESIHTHPTHMHTRYQKKHITAFSYIYTQRTYIERWCTRGIYIAVQLQIISEKQNGGTKFLKWTPSRMSVACTTMKCIFVLIAKK